MFSLLFSFAAKASAPPGNHQPLVFPRSSDKIFLRKISLAIFQNETNCKKENLLSWSEKEPFPSLGVGHAIWFPKDINPGYHEGFPDLVEYLKKKLKNNSTMVAANIDTPNIALPTVAVPVMLLGTPLGPAPWRTREEFLAADKSELLAFLSNPEVIDLQTEFMIQRMQASLTKILQASRNDKSLSPSERHRKSEQIYLHIKRLLSSEDGILSLTDYVNFKGEGLKVTEVSPMGLYPWGLKTVLERMSDAEPTTVVCNKKDLRHFSEDRCANYTFAKAVRWALGRLAFTWGPETSDARLLREKWLRGGWARRIRDTYMPGSVERISCEI